jgi:ABC-type multidrug transport system ATPase subunit
MKLIIEGLNKKYSNGIQALRNVTITIQEGMFGLLGPNGAGKSTLMRTIATLQEPDSGAIKLDTIDLIRNKEEVRKILGYLPQEFGVYPKVSAMDLLNHIAALKGIGVKSERKEVVEALLHRTNLWDSRKMKLGTYSGGMKQRFGIAQALLANPKLIIVDEPTAGLDPAERNRFLNLLSEIGENTIVILSTHIVDDVRELCTRMAIINKGRILYTGNPATAMEELEGKIWSAFIQRSELEKYRTSMKVVSERLIGGNREIHVQSETQPGPSFRQFPVGLEDVYFAHILNDDANVSMAQLI